MLLMFICDTSIQQLRQIKLEIITFRSDPATVFMRGPILECHYSGVPGTRQGRLNLNVASEHQKSLKIL